MWLSSPLSRPSAVFLVLFHYSQTVFVSSLLVLFLALGDSDDSGGWMGGRTGILNLGAQSGAEMGVDRAELRELSSAFCRNGAQQSF